MALDRDQIIEKKLAGFRGTKFWKSAESLLQTTGAREARR
jgi:hypothetical protein